MSQIVLYWHPMSSATPVACALAELGVPRAWELITESLGWPASDIEGLLERFDPDRLPREPWTRWGCSGGDLTRWPGWRSSPCLRLAEPG